ncbi:MAG: TIGR03761 family integrating conjugative element protein [Candidatus Competibacteraceae bacterium]
MTKASLSSSSPGPLQGETRLPLQTRYAQLLVLGRSGDGHPAIIGLLRFSALLRDVHTQAAQGDPYAEWWLLKVEQALNQAYEELVAAQQRLQAQFAAAPFQVDMPTSTAPVWVPLQFSSPQAFRGAALLAEFDKVAVAILTAGHHGLVTREAERRLLSQTGHYVRRAFASIIGYRALGLTRADLEQDNDKARQARQKMGALPEAVFTGSQRAQYGPRRVLSLKPKAGIPSTPGGNK